MTLSHWNPNTLARRQALLEAAARSGFQAQRSPRTVHLVQQPPHGFLRGAGGDAAHAFPGAGHAQDARQAPLQPLAIPRAMSGAAAARPALPAMSAASSLPVHVRPGTLSRRRCRVRVS